MAKKAITTEYFATVKTVQDVREVIITNLDKLDDPVFIKDFKKAYNAHRSDQQGKYGRYQAKAAVTADGYIKIARAIRDLTAIRVGRSKIKLGVAFKLGGVNLSGETRLIRAELKTMGFRWNPKTLEWYNGFAVMPTIPEIPKTVKAEPATKAKKDEKVAAKAPKKPKKPEVAKKPEKAETPAKVKATQPPVTKTGAPTLAEPRKLEGDEKAAAMAEFKAKAAAKRAARERRRTMAG